jgi:hypothetical protein
VTRAGKRNVLFVVGLFVVLAAGWQWTYRPGDPKNIHYLLWKAGIWRLNLETATGTMVGDGDRDKLVVGKTRAQLEKRFGPLLAPEQASAYLSGCYENSGWKDKRVLFIAHNSWWMVVFDGDKATELILIKGC